jgi:nitrogenase subunit NifH
MFVENLRHQSASGPIVIVASLCAMEMDFSRAIQLQSNGFNGLACPEMGGGDPPAGCGCLPL